jgi:hypothetical protein
VLLVTGDHLEQIRAAYDAVGTITAQLAAARPHAATDPRWCLAGVVIPPAARRHNSREAIGQALEIDVIAEVRHDTKVGAELLGRRNLPNGYSRSGYMRDIRELQTAIDRQLNRPAPPLRPHRPTRTPAVVPGEAVHAAG